MFREGSPNMTTSPALRHFCLNQRSSTVLNNTFFGHQTHVLRVTFESPKHTKHYSEFSQLQTTDEFKCHTCNRFVTFAETDRINENVASMYYTGL